MFKCPPTSHTGELSAAKTIGLAVSSDCRQEIKEVVDDVLSSVRVDTHGDESVEGVSRHVGIYACSQLAVMIRLSG